MSALEARVVEAREILRGAPCEELDAAAFAPAPAGRSAGLVLESEAAVILGGPGADSGRLLLYTNEPVAGGDSVRLVGPDLADLPKGPVPFAEVAIIRGEGITAEIFYQFMQRHKKLLDHPGFMVNQMKDSIWCRATAEAAAGGFAGASSTMLSRVHASFPEVKAVELWWITGNADLIGKVAAAARACADEVTSIKSGVWKDRGFDYKSCQLAGHCGSCADKKTCTSVRQIEAKVKMKRRQEEKAAASESVAGEEE